MISKGVLQKLYQNQGKSAQEIANIFECSVNKIRYWMEKYSITCRSISEAIYKKNNPNGDPFVIKYPHTLKEGILYGFGLGLYWGEGTKADKCTVRLGNTDPRLVKKFIDFLVKFFSIRRKDLKFSLQLFNDISVTEALRFWKGQIKVNKNQFYKSTITMSVRKGTYREKSRHGVLTVYYHNKKMRDELMRILENKKN
ncbi:hypothetical protein EPN28_03575 [Patescibacteria group bacterium]|nr:MAG: hypothetical protein EPN28_03575 [Patescibacteria group bacterium]